MNIKGIFCSLIVLAAFSTNANALTISGVVDNATGILASLAPVGSGLLGDVVFSGPAGGTAGAGDVSLIDVQLSSDLATIPGFCFGFGGGTCSFADGLYPDPVNPGLFLSPSLVSITSIEPTTSVGLDASGNPISGILDVIALSTTFGPNNILISFDFGLGTFSADGNQIGNPVPLGTASGTFAPAVVPIPAAAWLFGSALLGLAGLRRRA